MEQKPDQETNSEVMERWVNVNKMSYKFEALCPEWSPPQDLWRGPRELLYLEEWGAVAMMSSPRHLHSANRQTLSGTRSFDEHGSLVPKGLVFGLEAKNEIVKRLMGRAKGGPL